jgi:nicotinamidase-related amidase
MNKITLGPADAHALVDPQKDFARKHLALYVAGVKGEVSMAEVLANNKKLLVKKPGVVVVSADAHLPTHVEFKIFGPHCVIGTEGAEFCEEIAEVFDGPHILLSKGGNPDLISYSVATSEAWPNHVANLRHRRIVRVFVGGLAYTHCVGESAIAYACQGFETYVIRDATRSVPPPYGDPEKMDQKLQLYGVKLITMADIA